MLRGLNLRLDQEDRIVLLGANGNGKSTLVKALAGRLQPLAGEVKRDRRLRVGYFAQHQADELDLAGTPLSHMREALGARATDTQCRAQLARFGLDEARATTRVGELSGGEKARLLMALTTRDAPHLLLLDEPTNHLDMDARDALVRAITEFKGAVVLITHDADLVELVADRLWLVSGGTARPFDGDLDDYRRHLALERREASNGGAPREDGSIAAPKRDERRERAEARAASGALRDRLKRVEAEMAKLQQEARVIAEALADPRLYARNRPDLVARATARQAQLARELAALEGVWLEVSEKLEGAAAA